MKDNSSHHTESYSSQFETLSGLTVWINWLLFMLAVCTILTIAFFFKEIDLGMYIIIFALSIILIFKGYQDAKFIDDEMKLATEQIKILEEVDDIESFLQKAKKSVFRIHIDNLYTISLAHTEINQDNLIEILHTRLLARNKLIELFSSILITLGLIGTIVGLIVMMNGLSNVLANQDSVNLLSQLADSENGPLSGLGTAFYTTLLGAIFGGVILRILTNVVDTNITRYTAHLAELTEVYVLPYLRKTAIETHKEKN